MKIVKISKTLPKYSAKAAWYWISFIIYFQCLILGVNSAPWFKCILNIYIYFSFLLFQKIWWICCWWNHVSIQSKIWLTSLFFKKTFLNPLLHFHAGLREDSLKKMFFWKLDQGGGIKKKYIRKRFLILSVYNMTVLVHVVLFFFLSDGPRRWDDGWK